MSAVSPVLARVTERVRTRSAQERAAYEAPSCPQSSRILHPGGDAIDRGLDES